MVDDKSRKDIIDLTDHADFVFEFRVYAPDIGGGYNAGDAANYDPELTDEDLE